MALPSGSECRFKKTFISHGSITRLFLFNDHSEPPAKGFVAKSFRTAECARNEGSWWNLINPTYPSRVFSLEPSAHRLVIPFIDGETLREISNHDPEFICLSLLAFIKAMKRMHALGAVHCDLHSGNVVIHKVNGIVNATIIDFGYARRRSTRDERGDNIYLIEDGEDCLRNISSPGIFAWYNIPHSSNPVENTDRFAIMLKVELAKLYLNRGDIENAKIYLEQAKTDAFKTPIYLDLEFNIELMKFKIYREGNSVEVSDLAIEIENYHRHYKGIFRRATDTINELEMLLNLAKAYKLNAVPASAIQRILTRADQRPSFFRAGSFKKQRLNLFNGETTADPIDFDALSATEKVIYNLGYCLSKKVSNEGERLQLIRS